MIANFGSSTSPLLRLPYSARLIPGPNTLIELDPLLAELFVRLQEGLRPRSHNSCWKIDCLRYLTWHFVLDYRFSGRSQTKSQRLVSLSGEISRQGSQEGRGHGTWLFNLMIDDINTSDTEKWKYVGMDDTAIVEPVVKN